MSSPDRTTRYLQAAVSVTVPLVILTAGFISYSSLCELAQVVGSYGPLESHLFPLPIDFTLAGAISASFLLARWRAPWTARVVVGAQVFVAAVVTISGNALHGWATAAEVEWLRLAVSAVPAAALVGMTHTVTIMLRNRPHLQERVKGSDPAPQSTRSKVDSPKESQARSLLEKEQIALLSGEERAKAIAKVAEIVGGSRSYVRKVAQRVEQEARQVAPELEVIS